MTKTERLQQIAEEIRSMFNPPGTITFSIRAAGNQEIGVHGFQSNSEGTAFMREQGVGRREKTIITENTPWHSLTGVKDNITFVCYCAGLPQSCKIITEYKKVPKTEVRELEEHVEVPVTRVVCGNTIEDDAEVVQ